MDFGWGGVRLNSMKSMSNAEVKYMIKNCAWREVTKIWAEELEEWVEELEERPKLCVRGGFEARCMVVRRKKIRRILTKLGGGVQQS